MQIDSASKTGTAAALEHVRRRDPPALPQADEPRARDAALADQPQLTLALRTGLAPVTSLVQSPDQALMEQLAGRAAIRSFDVVLEQIEEEAPAIDPRPTDASVSGSEAGPEQAASEAIVAPAQSAEEPPEVDFLGDGSLRADRIQLRGESNAQPDPSDRMGGPESSDPRAAHSIAESQTPEDGRNAVDAQRSATVAAQAGAVEEPRRNSDDDETARPSGVGLERVGDAAARRTITQDGVVGARSEDELVVRFGRETLADRSDAERDEAKL